MFWRECIFAIAIASSGVGSGRRLAAALARRVLPAPGGPEKRILWCPAIAIVSARLARDCPLMSSRHGDGGLVFGGV